MQNSNEIFSQALNLTTPWYVKEVSFNSNEGVKELHITIAFTRGHKFNCGSGTLKTAYDTAERTWQHLNFFEHQCFIHCKVPRIKQTDGKISVQPVPWARKGSGFTLLFEAYSMLLIENEMPVSKASKILSVNDQRIWNVFNYWISKAHDSYEIKDLKKVGFDETSRKKGHDYVTICVDLEKKNVLFATEGKDSECIKKSVEFLKEKDVDISKLSDVSIDMSKAFICGCSEHLPLAGITFDKFHVVKEVHAAMDELRKLERKGNEMLKNHKYTFLTSKLSAKKMEERDLLIELYPKLGEGYRLLQMFKDFWEIEDIEEAESYLAFWCDLAMESKISSFQKVTQTIKAHWSGIVNYLKSRITNGLLEGINSKIQLAKKRARGYRNSENLINMIYFLCGKLEFDYPHYST